MKINQSLTLTPPKTENSETNKFAHNETKATSTKEKSLASDPAVPSLHQELVGSSKYEKASVGIPRKMSQVEAALETRDVASVGDVKKTVSVTKTVEVQTKAEVEAPQKKSFWAKTKERVSNTGKTFGKGVTFAFAWPVKQTGKFAVSFATGMKDMFTGHPINGMTKFGEGFMSLGRLTLTPIAIPWILGGTFVSAGQSLGGKQTNWVDKQIAKYD